MEWTLERITELTAEARREGAFYRGFLAAAEKAVAERDIDAWLAIARGTWAWLNDNLGVTLADLGDGPSRSYWETGELLGECTYRDGKMHGPAPLYYRNGQLAKDGTYQDGTLHGTVRTYDANGQLIEEVTYRDGKVVES